MNVKMLLVASLLLTTGCANNYNVKNESKEGQILTQVPEWYITSEENRGLFDRKNKHGYIYGVGSAVSASLQMAIDKATMQAKADLADQIQSFVSKDLEFAAAESGTETSESLETQTRLMTQNLIEKMNVTGYEEWNKGVFVTAANQYRVYVGLKWTRSKKNVLNDLIPRKFMKISQSTLPNGRVNHLIEIQDVSE